MITTKEKTSSKSKSPDFTLSYPCPSVQSVVKNPSKLATLPSVGALGAAQSQIWIKNNAFTQHYRRPALLRSMKMICSIFSMRTAIRFCACRAWPKNK